MKKATKKVLILMGILTVAIVVPGGLVALAIIHKAKIAAFLQGVSSKG